MYFKSNSLKKALTNFLFVILGAILLALPLTPVAAADIPQPDMIVPYPGGGGSGTQLLAKFDGTYDPTISPPSTVIAVNSKEIVQLVNDRYSITNRGGSVISTGSFGSLTKTSGIFQTDPQVMWDPSSSRFYYSVLENNSTTATANDGIGWGFSKTATPSSPADFCSYFNAFNYGSTSFPDRESLGDSSNFLIWGSLRVRDSDYAQTGSDAAWVSKPPAGTTCPSSSSFHSGVQSLTNASAGSLAAQQPLAYPYYPVVAKQTDNDPTSWILGLPSFVSANYLTLIQVSQGSNGLPVFLAPRNVPVPQYSCPSSVPQAGTTISGQPAPNLEANITLDGMYMGYDPRVAHEALWTSDTIAENNPGNPVLCGSTNGSVVNGAAVRWYEINPAQATTDQVGTIGSPTMGYYNSAIAPDRAVIGKTVKYGRDMAITFNSSSSTTNPAMWYEGKEGASAAFAPVLIKQSTGSNVDFSCFEPGVTSCRYGDWAGASPDPAYATSTAAFGQVWVSNEWNLPNLDDSSPVWRTEIARVGFY